MFSGSVVAMQFQCGSETRVIHANILDRDMFDPDAKTPVHTSWTMRLLQGLDRAVGSSVMEKPIFDLSADAPARMDNTSENMRDMASGNYDPLFQGSADRPSELYKAAQGPFPDPTVRLVSSTPFEPVEFVSPLYPPLAKLARVEGQVVFSVKVDKGGRARDVMFETGNPLLHGAVEEAVKRWNFPVQAEEKQIKVIIAFNTNCPGK